MYFYRHLPISERQQIKNSLYLLLTSNLNTMSNIILQDPPKVFMQSKKVTQNPLKLYSQPYQILSNNDHIQKHTLRIIVIYFFVLLRSSLIGYNMHTKSKIFDEVHLITSTLGCCFVCE